MDLHGSASHYHTLQVESLHSAKNMHSFPAAFSFSHWHSAHAGSSVLLRDLIAYGQAGVTVFSKKLNPAMNRLGLTRVK